MLNLSKNLVFLLFMMAMAFGYTSESRANEVNLDGYQKRFKLIKNNTGELQYVQMNFFNQSFKILPFVEQVKNDIKREILNMKEKGFDNEVESFLLELENSATVKNDELAENIRVVRASMGNIKDVDVDHFFGNVKTKGVLTQFQKELREVFAKYSLATIASTEDAKYFYKRNVTYEVVKRVLNFAKKKFTSVPLLNLASYVIVKVHDLVLEQRTFHQNMLLHYLQTVDDEKLGMTKLEADKVFSSIFESRISVLGYRESQNAAANWERYGLDKFYAMFRSASNRLRRSEISEKLSRYNYAFAEVINDKGERVVVNLFDKKHTFSSKLSVAYNYEKPTSVRRFRSLMNLAQVGLGFIPLPNWLKSQVNSFMDSYYVSQKLTEGALVGYFESQNDAFMANKVVKQMINPYIVY